LRITKVDGIDIQSNNIGITTLHLEFVVLQNTKHHLSLY